MFVRKAAAVAIAGGAIVAAGGTAAMAAPPPPVSVNMTFTVPANVTLTIFGPSWPGNTGSLPGGGVCTENTSNPVASSHTFNDTDSFGNTYGGDVIYNALSDSCAVSGNSYQDTSAEGYEVFVSTNDVNGYDLSANDPGWTGADAISNGDFLTAIAYMVGAADGQPLAGSSSGIGTSPTIGAFTASDNGQSLDPTLTDGKADSAGTYFEAFPQVAVTGTPVPGTYTDTITYTATAR